MQIRRLQETFEHEENHRVSRTVERLQASMRTHEKRIRGVPQRRRAPTNPQAVMQMQRRRVQEARSRNRAAGIDWRGTCTLQLFAKPFTSIYRQTDTVETGKSDFSRFQPLPDVQKKETTYIRVIEPDDAQVPPNSRCGVQEVVESQSLAVPTITIRAATPSTCSDSGGSDMSLFQSVSKYQKEKRELGQLVRDIKAIVKDTER